MAVALPMLGPGSYEYALASLYNSEARNKDENANASGVGHGTRPELLVLASCASDRLVSGSCDIS